MFFQCIRSQIIKKSEKRWENKKANNHTEFPSDQSYKYSAYPVLLKTFVTGRDCMYSARYER
jgi:hypothetical protein